MRSEFFMFRNLLIGNKNLYIISYVILMNLLENFELF